MKKNRKLDVIFVLDKSGSMSNNVDETISNFNEYLEREKNNKYQDKLFYIGIMIYIIFQFGLFLFPFI